MHFKDVLTWSHEKNFQSLLRITNLVKAGTFLKIQLTAITL